MKHPNGDTNKAALKLAATDIAYLCEGIAAAADKATYGSGAGTATLNCLLDAIETLKGVRLNITVEHTGSPAASGYVKTSEEVAISEVEAYKDAFISNPSTLIFGLPGEETAHLLEQLPELDSSAVLKPTSAARLGQPCWWISISDTVQAGIRTDDGIVALINGNQWPMSIYKSIAVGSHEEGR